MMHRMKRLHVTALFSFAASVVLGCSAKVGPVTAGDVITSEQADFVVEQVTGGFEHPWGMAFLPDGSILVTERPGDLRLVVDGELTAKPIDGVPKVFARGQGGLLDVAIDPDFENNQRIYLSYAGVEADRRSSTHVARGRLVDGSLEDVEVIFRSNSVSDGTVHWGSRIGFDPAGDLYVTLGDRGSQNVAQSLSRHGGSVVRIRPDGSVPEDNPFVGKNSARPEIYSYGHRNPQGLAVHPETGRVWTQEHGPRGGDEVNLIEAGANYGWPEISWGINYSGSPINGGLREKEGMEQPVHYWDPSIAPSGMTFYDGDAFPEWQGDLFVGALKYRLITRLEMDGDEVVGEEQLLRGDLGRIRDVRTGPDGFLYVLTDERVGRLYRIRPAD